MTTEEIGDRATKSMKEHFPYWKCEFSRHLQDYISAYTKGATDQDAIARREERERIKNKLKDMGFTTGVDEFFTQLEGEK